MRSLFRSFTLDEESLKVPFAVWWTVNQDDVDDEDDVGGGAAVADDDDEYLGPRHAI